MIACINPNDENYEENLSTLTYATKTKAIQNKPIEQRRQTLKLEVKQEDQLIRELQERNDFLEEQLRKLTYRQNAGPYQRNEPLNGVRYNFGDSSSRFGSRYDYYRDSGEKANKRSPIKEE